MLRNFIHGFSYLRHIARNSDKVLLEGDCEATAASLHLMISDIYLLRIYFLDSEQQKCTSVCAQAQTDMHVCSLHITSINHLVCTF